MRASDVEALGECSRLAFAQLDASLHEPRRVPARGEQEHYLGIYRHLLSTDPDGCHVAEDDGRLVGGALSFVRDDLWCLSLLVVATEAQGSGVGRRLLDAALAGSRDSRRGALASSLSPAAMRRYVRAGFTPHPALRATGVARSTGLPAVTGVRSGADTEFADAVDARVRGARRGSDHDVLARGALPFTTDTAAGAGYAYVPPNGRVVVAATEPAAARALLVTCLAESDGREIVVGHLTAEQAWALGPCLDAGLALRWAGPLMLRGMTPATPYVPSGLFL